MRLDWQRLRARSRASDEQTSDVRLGGDAHGSSRVASYRRVIPSEARDLLSLVILSAAKDPLSLVILSAAKDLLLAYQEQILRCADMNGHLSRCTDARRWNG